MLTLSEIDEVLIRYADTLSPADISFKIEGALTASQVRHRITQLLDTPDWLTAAQQDQLVTMKMRNLITKFEEMTLTARVGEVLFRALEGLGARLDRRVEATERDLTSLYSFQGTILLDAVSLAMDHMKKSITEGDPDLEAQWDRHLETALRYAQIEISKHEAGADPAGTALELEEIRSV